MRVGLVHGSAPAAVGVRNNGTETGGQIVSAK